MSIMQQLAWHLVIEVMIWTIVILLLYMTYIRKWDWDEWICSFLGALLFLLHLIPYSLA